MKHQLVTVAFETICEWRPGDPVELRLAAGALHFSYVSGAVVSVEERETLTPDELLDQIEKLIMPPYSTFTTEEIRGLLAKREKAK